VKFLLTLNFFAAGMLLSGCADGKGGTTPAAAGSAPGRLATVNLMSGTLVVFSAYKVNPDFNPRDPYRPEFSDYEIYTAGGKLLRRVHNNSGTILQNPATVELSTGEYRVVARANGYGHVTVPVFIEPGQNTVLHLEGTGSWPAPAVINPTNVVRLPNGKVIGWQVTGDHSTGS